MTGPVDHGPVLVLGATGDQGGAVVRALLREKVAVRALVRDPASAGARSLTALGAELACGDFDDEAGLGRACQGARAVFSVQPAPLDHPDSERDQGRRIIAAARAAGVPQMIHTSVSGTGTYRQAKEWGTGRWNENYWESKGDVEQMVRDAGFRFHTILRPAFLMENFTAPKAAFMFPDLVNDEIMTTMRLATTIALVTVDDVGQAAAAAVVDPERFDRANIELAGDALTLVQVAALLSDVSGRRIAASWLPAAEVLSRGQYPAWVVSQEWNNETPYPATPADALAYGIATESMADWASRHPDEIIALRS